MLPGPAVPGSCLVSYHFLWAILSTSTVHNICLQVEVRAGVRVEPEVQGGQVHHRAGAHDQGERLGERELEGEGRRLYISFLVGLIDV